MKSVRTSRLAALRARSPVQDADDHEFMDFHAVIVGVVPTTDLLEAFVPTLAVTSGVVCSTNPSAVTGAHAWKLRRHDVGAWQVQVVTWTIAGIEAAIT